MTLPVGIAPPPLGLISGKGRKHPVRSGNKRCIALKDGLIAAAKADFISLTAFEVGLFGWMAVMAWTGAASDPRLPHGASRGDVSIPR